MAKDVRETTAMISEGERTVVLPLHEEVVTIEKRLDTLGRVRITSVVDTVEEFVRETLHEDRVDVTRVPIDKYVDHAPQVRTENGVTIVPILEEVIVVEKRLVLKEELHISHRRSEENVEVPITLRKERAVIERLDDQGQPLENQETRS